MRYIFTLFSLIILLLSEVSAQCVSASWVKQFGGSTLYESFFTGSHRNDGKFLVGGTMGSGTVNLGAVAVTSPKFYSYFFGIHDSSGTFESANLIGSYNSSGDQLTISKVELASDNSIFICGYYKGSTVELGGTLLPSCSRLTIFVARYNSTMQYMWHKLGSQTGADQWAYDLTLDAQKNIYITGAFEDEVFLFQDSVLNNKGNYLGWTDDAFLLKLDSTGLIRYLVGIAAASNASESGRTVTADSSGNIILSGITDASNVYLSLTDQVAVYVPSGPGNSTFIAKYDGSTGRCKWGKIIAGFYSNDLLYPSRAIRGESNSIYMIGTITGTVQFSNRSVTAPDQNGFLARLDSSANCEWFQMIGGTNSSEAATSVYYREGRIAVSGYLFSNNTYMGTFPLYSLVSSPVAYSGLYDSAGDLIFARANASSPSNNISNRTSLIDQAGNLMVWGSYKSTQTWYPVTLTNSLANYKSFLVKYKQTSATPAFTISAGPDKSTTCATSIQLSATTTPASGVTIGWYPEMAWPGNTSKTPTVNPGVNTTYVFHGYYQGCSLSDTVNLSYTNNALTLNAGGDISLCSGDSMQIIPNISQSGATFSWVPNKYINTASSQNPWVKPPLNTTYIVTATLSGCKAIDTIRVVSNPKPYIYLAKQNYISPYWYLHLCQGSPLDIDMGDPLNSYNVLTPSAVTNVNNNEVTILANTNQLLKVQATTIAGCTRTDSVLVRIHQNQAAPPIMTTLSNRSACPGDSVNFSMTLHNSLQYSYQFSWYAGWQVDSLDGEGWKDINYADPGYEIFNMSSGFSTSTYYSTLRIWNVGAGMNGYKYRLHLRDYCSPKSYSNTATLTVGPKITAQPLTKSFCQNATDSIFVNSSSPSVSYQWEIKQNGNYVPLVNQPGVLVANGRYLRVQNVQPSLDGTIVRCRLTGCTPASFSYSDSAVIKVISIPVITSQSIGDTICSGVVDSLVVNVAGGPYTYQWYANGIALTYSTSQVSGHNTRKLTFNPVWPSQNNVVYTCRISNAGCGFNVYSDTAIWYVKPQPTLSVTPAVQTICNQSGSGVISVSGASTYTWGPASGLSSTSGSQVTASPTAASTYTITGTSTIGCANTATAVVNVSSTISVTLTSSANSVCQGSSVTLTSSGANSYSWSPSSSLSSATGSVVIASPVNSTAYTVTGTNGLCTATAVKSISTLTTPVNTLTPTSASICSGNSATLTASGAVFYNWSPSTGLNATNTGTVTATPTTSTTYTVTGSNYQNCNDIDYVYVEVNNVPSLTVTALTDTLCMGSSTTLSASGAASYSWYPATGLSSTSGPAVTASPVSTQTYTISGSNGSCSAVATLLLRVVPGPGFIVNSSNSTICAGDNTLLTANNNAHTYSWEPPAGLSSTSGFSVSATPSVTTTYTITGTNTYGCTAVRNVTVNVNQYPVVTVTSNEDTICAGTSTILTAAGASQYVWSPASGLNMTTGSNVTASPAGTLTYTVTGSNGSCSDQEYFVLAVTQAPAVSWSSGVPDSVCTIGSTYNLPDGTPSGGVFSGPGVSGNLFDPSVAGAGSHTMLYSYIDPVTGCEGSASENVYVDVCAGDEARNTAPVIKVWQKESSIMFFQNGYFTNAFSASVYSATGELVTTREFVFVNEGSIDLPVTAQGLYYIFFSDRFQVKVIRLVVVR